MTKCKRILHGVAINDADYTLAIRKEHITLDGKRVKETIWECPYYVLWTNMLERAISVRFKSKNKSYTDVGVCTEWLRFSNFRAWCKDYEEKYGVALYKGCGLFLDKDIISQGNKTYCPEYCSLVDREANNIVQNSPLRELPLGVYVDKRDFRYYAQCGGRGRKRHLGSFKTVEESHKAWQIAKKNHIEEVASRQVDERVRDGLLFRVAKLESAIEKGEMLYAF